MITQGGGGSGGIGSIPKDMFFATTAERDLFTTNNPTRIKQGVTCAVVNGSSYDYYQWDETNTQWRDANLIYQGKTGDTGEKGDAGDPTTLIDDSLPASNKTYSSIKVEALLEEGTGLRDNGTVENLDESYQNYFENHPAGEYYLIGWTEESGLPISIPEIDRIFAVTTFIGYGGDDNGCRIQFNSGIYGSYEATKTKGIWGLLKKLDNAQILDQDVNNIKAENGLEVIVENGEATFKQTTKQSVWPVHQVDTAVPIEIDSDEMLGIDYRYNLIGDTQHTLILKTENISDHGQIKVSCEISGEGLSHPVKVITESGKSFYISTPTVFIYREHDWFIDESSQLVHLENTTSFESTGSAYPKKVVYGVAVDPSSDITMGVSDEGVLIIGRNFVPPTDTVDIAFWWTDNAEPTASDILNAMSQAQTGEIISHTDGFTKDDIQVKSLTAKRDENSFKYAYFAWHKGFFTPEPTKVDTGFGGPSSWISTEVNVDGEIYKVLTVEVTNNTTSLEDYALIQEGQL